MGEASAKQMTVRLYKVPTPNDEHAGTIMDASDMLLAQDAEISRLREANTALECTAGDTQLAKEEIARLRSALEAKEKAMGELAEAARGLMLITLAEHPEPPRWQLAILEARKVLRAALTPKQEGGA